MTYWHLSGQNICKGLHQHLKDVHTHTGVYTYSSELFYSEIQTIKYVHGIIYTNANQARLIFPHECISLTEVA